MTLGRLRQILLALPGEPEVHVYEDRGLIGTITTPAFGDRNEAHRQAMVWEHLSHHATDEELANVVFIFTYPPEGQKAG
jgi:hypothetical protein